MITVAIFLRRTTLSFDQTPRTLFRNIVLSTFSTSWCHAYLHHYFCTSSTNLCTVHRKVGMSGKEHGVLRPKGVGGHNPKGRDSCDSSHCGCMSCSMVQHCMHHSGHIPSFVCTLRQIGREDQCELIDIEHASRGTHPSLMSPSFA